MLKERKQCLIDMPLDVLIEIFLFLEPLDLLHLTRTTKGLRAFLLDRRRASALWKNVIDNLKGFPPCPGHISPPAYTHLTFVPVCHGCFRPCETVEWELRMRCCPDCFPKMTIPRDSIHRDMYGLNLPMTFEHCKLHDIAGGDVVATIDRVQHAFCFSRTDWKLFQSRKRPRNVSAGEFLAQQDNHWKPVRTHARLCQLWEYGRLKEKAAQLSRVREQRVKDIKDGLSELGWTDVVSHSRFLRLPEVRKLEPLTPTEWTQVFPQLLRWAQETRKHLMWNYLMNTLTPISLRIQRELESDTSLRVRPREIDIATLPAVQSMLENGIDSYLNPDRDHDVLKKKLFRILPPAIRKWSSGAVKELEQLAREQLGLPPLSNPSSLPSVVFQCKVCSRSSRRCSRFTFDKALCHDHLYKAKPRENNLKGEHTCEMSILDKLLMRYGTNPRSIQVLRVDVTVSLRVENLIKRMGKNPNRVSIDELRRSSVKVVCGLCHSEDAKRIGFEDALDHCLNTHIKDKETEVWTRMPARK